MATIEDVLAELKDLRKDNSGEHKEIFDRLRGVELKQAHTNGAHEHVHHHSRKTNGKDGEPPILPQRKGEMIRGVPTLTLIALACAAMAGERVIHWIGMLLGLIGNTPH